VTISGAVSLATVVALAIGSSVTVRSSFHPRHVHLGSGTAMMLGSQSGKEVDEKAKHIEEVDKGNCPLQNSGGIPLLLVLRYPECNAEGNLEQDEKELNPETDSQNSVLSEVDAQALVFPAYKYGRHYVASDEEDQEGVVEAMMVESIEYREKDEACGTCNGCNDANSAVDLLPNGRVIGKATRMA
jgi:hypothetical protein